MITDARFLHDDRLDLRVEHGDETRPADTATVPGHALHTGLGEHWLLLSPAAADRLGLATWQVGWALDARRPPDQQRQDDLADALRPARWPPGSRVERNRDYDDTRPLLLLLAAVSAVVTVAPPASPPVWPPPRDGPTCPPSPRWVRGRVYAACSRSARPA